MTDITPERRAELRTQVIDVRAGKCVAVIVRHELITALLDATEPVGDGEVAEALSWLGFFPTADTTEIRKLITRLARENVELRAKQSGTSSPHDFTWMGANAMTNPRIETVARVLIECDAKHGAGDWQELKLAQARAAIAAIDAMPNGVADAARAINRVIEWLKRPDWGQWPYMEGSEIYDHKEDALVDLHSAIAALAPPENASE
jgi:crotonobetainyl-CoA:carnitine CoA-transferase CaiB-like acyl-CoA transferase